jgi:hypothetical protein
MGSLRTILTQPDPAVADAVLDGFERRAQAVLDAEGVVRARTVVGCFVCR